MYNFILVFIAVKQPTPILLAQNRTNYCCFLNWFWELAGLSWLLAGTSVGAVVKNISMGLLYEI